MKGERKKDGKRRERKKEKKKNGVKFKKTKNDSTINKDAQQQKPDSPKKRQAKSLELNHYYAILD